MSREIEKFNREIGLRIKALRKKAGLTQKGFADKVGVSQPSVVRFEAGTRMPDAHVIKTVAEQFGCAVEWLIFGENRE